MYEENRLRRHLLTPGGCILMVDLSAASPAYAVEIET